MKSKKNVIILGGGLSGLSTAYHLKNEKGIEFKIFEKESVPGGLCASIKKDGFIFDYSGHLLHMKDEYTKELVNKLLGQNLNHLKRNAWIYFLGEYIPYPFQAHLYALPPDIAKECLGEFIRVALRISVKNPKNFEEWINMFLGKGIAKHFMIPYNKKLWVMHPKNLTCEWVKYVPKPSIDDILDSLIRAKNKDFGYNSYFYYPKRGGINSLIVALEKDIKDHISYNSEIKKIDVSNRVVITKNEEKSKYDYLVSSMPLPELIKSIEKCPPKIKNAAQKLKWVSVYCVNLGINRSNISDKHWIYFSEKNFIFHRVGFQSNFSDFVVPKGTSSLYIEISFPGNKKINEKNILSSVRNDLKKAGIIKKDEEIILCQSMLMKYAYVIYDKDYFKNTALIHKYLKKNNIFSIGRYGNWDYSAMEDAILAGRKTAQEINLH